MLINLVQRQRLTARKQLYYIQAFIYLSYDMFISHKDSLFIFQYLIFLYYFPRITLMGTDYICIHENP